MGNSGQLGIVREMRLAIVALVALIAAIVLNLRQRRDHKQLHPAEQIAVRRKDRVRIVAMPSEKE